jgi:predicted metal-dependent peptidase
MEDNKIVKQVLESGWDEDTNGKKWEDYETIVCPDGQIIDMVDLIDQQYKAMAALTHLAPMFGGFISKLRYVYTFKVQSQATDGFNVFVNPQFTANLDFTGKCFVMAHELMHCLMNHMRREQGRDHTKSNIAADYEVNTTLVSIGLFKESTVKNLKAYIDMKFKDMGFEKIYDICNSSSSDDMSNDDQAKQAQQNQDSEDGDGDNNQGSGSGGDNKPEYSADYKAGWAQAIADYKAGKIK